MKRWPLKRYILVVTIIFALVMCLLISTVNYFTARRARYQSFEFYIRDVLNYTASAIDTDDLAECIRTGVESEKYRELQRFMDQIKEHINLHFLYVIIPVSDAPVDNIINVIAAVDSEEYETLADELVYLNMPAGDSYSPATARKYLKAYESGQLSFFIEKSEWGEDYTGLLPLYDSQGNKIAALCMDVDIQEIRTQLRSQLLVTAAVTVLVSAVFVLAFVTWSKKRITAPIEQLENCVTDFADNSHLQDPEALALEVPELNCAQEVRSLAEAVKTMGRNLRDNVEHILTTTSELDRVRTLARKDALTKVGNKTAYLQYCEELRERMEQEGPLPYAMLMLDANYLKRINDSFGHDKGDLYLKKCSEVVCEVYAHSPVFRVGGDEFAVVLTGNDFENRDLLLAEARRRYDALQHDGSLPEWERVSAALGMAEFDPDVDQSIEDVFSRADKAMYEEKKRLGAVRE